MIASLSLILLCQLIGEVAVRALGVPVPGPVVGLVLLLLLLLARDRPHGLVYEHSLVHPPTAALWG